MKCVILKRNGDKLLVKWASFAPRWESISFMRGTAEYRAYKTASTIPKVKYAANVAANVAPKCVHKAPESALLVSRFPSAKRELAKKSMNADFCQMVAQLDTRAVVLALDAGPTWRSLRALSATPNVASIIVPNDEVYKSAPLILGSCTVSVFATKLGALLASQPALRVDAALLDFCGQLKTCANEIKETAARLRIGPRGAPFLTTLCYTRGGASPNEIRESTESAFRDLGLFGELVTSSVSNGMVTHAWLVRKRFVLK